MFDLNNGFYEKNYPYRWSSNTWNWVSSSAYENAYLILEKTQFTKRRFGHFPGVLEGVGRSGRLVGIISISPGTSPIPCWRNKKTKYWKIIVLWFVLGFCSSMFPTKTVLKCCWKPSQNTIQNLPNLWNMSQKLPQTFQKCENLPETSPKDSNNAHNSCEKNHLLQAISPPWRRKTWIFDIYSLHS